MDNNFIIENLLQQSEGVRLEFKSAPDIDAIGKVITAFVNTQGGDLIVGVEDNGDIIGVEDAGNKAIAIRDTLVKWIKPTAPISAQVITIKKKEVILISVWEGANKPYQYKGSFYSRIGQSTRATDVNRLSSLIRERRESEFHWERMPVLGAALNELDFSEIKRTIKFYQEYKSDHLVKDAEDFLIQMGLVRNGNITNACMVLFGKKPSRFIPQSKIRVTVYPTKGDYFLYDNFFDGNIFRNITAIWDLLDITLGKNIKVSGVLREEKYNYPILALREGLMNAIIHRDYNSVNGFMQIDVFANRTEINSYGRLPNGITTKDLKIEHESILRNPDIAQICFVRKYIEMLGGGTLRMINDCKKNGFKSPQWKEKNNVVKVVFPGVHHGREGEGVSEGVSEGVKLEIKGVDEQIKKELANILTFLRKKPKRRVPDIAEYLGKGVSTVERYIKILRDNDLIEFRGAPKTGGYDIK